MSHPTTLPAEPRLIRAAPREEAGDLVAFLCAHEWPYHVVPQPTAAEAERWIQAGRFESRSDRSLWVVRGDERVGLVALHDLEDPTPVFDLRLGASVRGLGLGRRVLGLVARYVFVELGRHRVEGHTRADNVGMRRAFRAAGWVKEAHYRSAWPGATGGWHDAITYALLEADWRAGRTTPVPWGDEP